MISVRDIDYDTKEDSDEVYSRLTWAVEKVDGLFSQLVNGVTVDTNRPWVGVYDKEKMEFGLIETSRFFNLQFLQVIVRGQIIPADNKTKINVKFRLGWFTLFISTAMYLGTIAMIIVTTIFGELKDVWNLIIWILVFPVLWTIILNWKMNKVEKKVEDLFGLS
ncbi:MAG: hypothetical protein ACK5SJ_18055 [Bacteroidota bacterium]